ncbi:hypothetical protein Y1Q_0008790 [Alligator mississippiensis]|uniref:Uncharacterized protein n=1 Tax=Alligator mississippiensis TaxID=8496 RepID=A0A151NA39_ALLMI|nr:hypothetical protein Y1Q_0008790 [Alligator mississippiensis]
MRIVILAPKTKFLLPCFYFVIEGLWYIVADVEVCEKESRTKTSARVEEHMEKDSNKYKLGNPNLDSNNIPTEGNEYIV